ncbi:MAG: hypothetical protein R3212_07285 [Xanthomonadales bacterium]|nr:hypothetical protein [Xanthomonadales bacterium]
MAGGGKRPGSGQKGGIRVGGGIKRETRKKMEFRAALREYCRKIKVNPFHFMAHLIAEEKVPLEMKFQAARELAQYLEPKLRAVQVSGDAENPLEVRDHTARQARIQELLGKLNGQEVEAGVNGNGS